MIGRFAHGQTLTRLRAPLVADPYSGELTRRDWAHAQGMPIDGFAVSPGGSVVTDTVNRTQVETKPTLIWMGPPPIPDVDRDGGTECGSGGLFRRMLADILPSLSSRQLKEGANPLRLALALLANGGKSESLITKEFPASSDVTPDALPR